MESGTFFTECSTALSLSFLSLSLPALACLWVQVQTNRMCRKLKVGCGLCTVLFGVMIWFVIFGLVALLPCSETQDVPGLTSCVCSEGFTHEFLPECTEQCGCESDAGCALCCQFRSNECRVDRDVYLNACGLDMHEYESHRVCV